MLKMQILLYAAVICLPFAINAFAAETGHRTVIYDNRTTEVGTPPATLSTDDLWVTLADLKLATGFVIKPQGVCRDATFYREHNQLCEFGGFVEAADDAGGILLSPLCKLF